MRSLFEHRNADFSEDRIYRYSLTIIWDARRPSLGMIGLNPSVADEWRDDNTVRREKCYAKDWGFGGLVKANMYAYISTDREVLYHVEDPIGPRNTVDFMLEKFSQCPKVVACWGVDAAKVNPERVEKVLHGFPHLYCLGTNGDNSPKHPLYLPKELTPVPYNF